MYMFKFYAAIVVLLLLSLTVNGQNKNDEIYIFKSDWSSAKSFDEAVYFMQVNAATDTEYYCRYYQKFGPMVKQECYKDPQLTIPNGVFAWYTKDGRLDSSGDVVDGKKDGNWYTYNDTGKAVSAVIYEHGKRIKKADYLTGREYYPDGSIKEPEQQKDTAKDEHIYVGAAYKGGEKGWSQYLVKNLKTPERFQNIIRAGSCNVIISFTVNKEGMPIDMMLAKSCEWSADNEVFRIIKDGGKWQPASIDGKNVLYRQKQSVTFQVSTE